MNNKTVSERLKYLRSINKKTQKEFAEFLEIPNCQCLLMKMVKIILQ